MARCWMVAGALGFALFASSATAADDEFAHVVGAGADLRGRSFEGLGLGKADLRAADLRGASFRGASLVDAQLQGADLRGAELQGADLRGADLRGADLRGARVARADFSGANLMLADLREIDFFLEIPKPRPPSEPTDARPQKAERIVQPEAATREFSVRGAVLDRALQSKPLCVYPPTSAVDVLHDFDASKGLPLIADGSGDAPATFSAARTTLFAELGCGDQKGEVASGLAKRALDTTESPNVAGYDAGQLRRALAAHDCAGGWSMPEEMKGALARTLDLK